MSRAFPLRLEGEEVQVYTTSCPLLKDGRRGHYMVKVDGQWVCENCGEGRASVPVAV